MLTELVVTFLKSLEHETEEDLVAGILKEVGLVVVQI